MSDAAPAPRMEGRVSDDGEYYEVWYGDRLMKRTPLDEARECSKHKASIKRNGWEPLP
jgi:hypothetical protein